MVGSQLDAPVTWGEALDPALQIDPAGLGRPVAAGLVQGGHARAAMGVEASAVTPFLPAIGGELDSGGRREDAAVVPISIHGHIDVAGAQLLESVAFARVDLASVLGELLDVVRPAMDHPRRRDDVAHWPYAEGIVRRRRSR
jgi:hypothetical protein